MNDRETFLARWSRRKHAVAAENADADSRAAPSPAASERPVEHGEPAEGTTGAEVTQGNAVVSPAGDSDTAVPLFDPASLPPIESIAAETDIRAFLAPGVPSELTRAALRRAWAADPKIRDFVGLADYDWDFNTPGSMAGFGPLEMTEELRQIAARIIGRPPGSEAAGENSDLAGPVGSRDESPPAERVHDVAEQDASERDPPPRRDPPVAAAQNRPDAAGRSQTVVPLRHGGALPK
jgi:Protein of unknown function (DUF3306)